MGRASGAALSGLDGPRKVSALLDGQEDHDSAASKDQIRGSFLRIFGLAAGDAAVDDGPAIVIGSAETEFTERGVLEQIGKFSVERGRIQFEIAGRLGSAGGILVKPEGGGAAAAGSQDCSPIQRPSLRNEYRPSTAISLPSCAGRSLRTSQTVTGTIGSAAAAAAGIRQSSAKTLRHMARR